LNYYITFLLDLLKKLGYKGEVRKGRGFVFYIEKNIYIDDSYFVPFSFSFRLFHGHMHCQYFLIKPCPAKNDPAKNDPAKNDPAKNGQTNIEQQEVDVKFRGSCGEELDQFITANAQIIYDELIKL